MTTTLYSVLSTAVRIAALLHIVNVLAALVPYFVSPPAGQGSTAAWIVIGGSLISAVFGVLLWLYPGLLVRPAVSRAAHETLESPLSADSILRIGLCLLGVWFAFNGVMSLVYVGMRATLASSLPEYGQGISLFLPDMLYAALSIVLGAALAFGSRGLVGLLSRLRDGR